ncbi:DNRLRE domain-containing protein [Clostridium neuense]|uniref:DNRLRE domain-containing protein n=1 Tax=Clostridium neuense TaxID=1728934 RepID=A0ABW8TAR2_9CLOT
MPTLTFQSTGTTFISQNNPTLNYSSSPLIYVGQFSGPTDNYRSIIEFNISSIPINYSIVSATLLLYIARNDVPALSKPIYVYRILQNYDINTVTYSNQPLTFPTAEGSTTITNEIGTVISIDVTASIKNWYSGLSKNLGFLLRGDETQTSLVGFTSANYPINSFTPTLIINVNQGTITQSPSQTINTADTLIGSNPIPLGTNSATFAIQNTGTSNSGYVTLQLSPDGTTWIDDISPVMTLPSLEPGQSIILNTRGHMAYVRAAVQSVVSGQSAQLTITPSIWNL